MARGRRRYSFWSGCDDEQGSLMGLGQGSDGGEGLHFALILVFLNCLSRVLGNPFCVQK